MTFDALTTTLLDALATGKPGTPVSLRLHLQCVDPRTDLSSACAAVVRLTTAVFREPPATLMARRDPQDRQWNVLLGHAGGQIALLTLGRGSVAAAQCHLLVVGNHGIVRLEGEDFDGGSLQAAGEEAERWRRVLEASFGRREALPL